jgi:hypothetical protein
MATITPTFTIDPTVMTNNWATGVAANAQKWLYKYLHPKALFNANPAAAQVSWQSGINAAMARNAYANGLTKASPAAAAAAASTYGVANYGASGTQKKAKFAAKAPALASAMSSLRAQIDAMPNATVQDRIQRSVAWQNGMAALKGTF